MTPNNNFFPLPWYKSVKYQDFRKSYAYGNVFQLIAPDRSLLPFQIQPRAPSGCDVHRAYPV